MQIDKSFKKSLIIEISKKIQKLENTEVNQEMKSLVTNTNQLNIDFYGYDNKGCLALLEFWGNPRELMEKYITEEKKNKIRIK